MNVSFKLDTSVFERSLKTYLARLPAEKIPAALNKKAFFIALRAMSETPKVPPERIQRELDQQVFAKSENGSVTAVKLGFVLAAKSASKKYRKAVATRKRKGKNWKLKLWRKTVWQRYNRIRGARQRNAGFMRAGWLSVVKQLSPFVKSKAGAPPADRSGIKLYGSRGNAIPAKPGWSPVVTITNSAQSLSDRHFGLITHGGPALQRAFNLETADTNAFLEREAFKELTDQFNREQR